MLGRGLQTPGAGSQVDAFWSLMLGGVWSSFFLFVWRVYNLVLGSGCVCWVTWTFVIFSLP